MEPVSWTCFYCSNPVNRHTSGVVADIVHHFKHGGERRSVRAFHNACYDNFIDVGRPYNPDTRYEVVVSEDVRELPPLPTIAGVSTW
jgi:hypothetical protein